MKYLLLLTIFVLSACGAVTSSTPEPDSPAMGPNTGSPSEEPADMSYAPQSNDVNLSRESIFIEEMGLVIRESYPPQISLNMSGNLPTPCHALRAIVNEPDAENKINVEVYTVVDPNMMCTQVLKPFTQNIDLGTFPSGHYTVWVNGESAGAFDS